MPVGTCPLLHLPRLLRYQIYLEAGVVHGKVIELGFRGDNCCRKYHGGVIDMRQTCKLMYICRTFHDEVSFILYSRNSFSLHYCRSGFEPLYRLTPQTLSFMTRFEISFRRVIRPSCQHEFLVNYSSQIYRHQEFHEEPLRRSDEQVIDEWLFAAKYLFSNILPNKLEFGFICDTHELELDVAERIVEPFLNCPPLKDCKIRLGVRSHKPLADLAKKTAIVAARPHDPSFPKIDLPDEILLRILRYTGLLQLPTRLLEVRGHKGRDYLGLRRYSPHNDEIYSVPPFDHHLSSDKDYECCSYSSNILCYCWRHSSWTRSCRCWQPPTALFLVCRQWMRVVQETLMQENRVVVEPLTWEKNSQDMKSCRLSSLLRNTLSLRTALHWLKDIEVMMWPTTRAYGECYISEESASWSLNVSFPSKDITVDICAGPASFRLCEEALSGVAVSTIMSFFPGLELLTGLQRFRLYVRTDFPCVAFDDSLSDGQEKSTVQRLPYKLERGLQVFVSHIMEGGLENSLLADAMRLRGLHHFTEERAILEYLFSKWYNLQDE